jgi:hypothetical protein
MQQDLLNREECIVCDTRLPEDDMDSCRECNELVCDDCAVDEFCSEECRFKHYNP